MGLGRSRAPAEALWHEAIRWDASYPFSSWSSRDVRSP